MIKAGIFVELHEGGFKDYQVLYFLYYGGWYNGKPAKELVIMYKLYKN